MRPSRQPQHAREAFNYETLTAEQLYHYEMSKRGRVHRIPRDLPELAVDIRNKDYTPVSGRLDAYKRTRHQPAE